METDGFTTHGSRIGFERDRQRDLDLARAGWHVIRLSWRQVTERPEHVAGMLRERLGTAARYRAQAQLPAPWPPAQSLAAS